MIKRTIIFILLLAMTLSVALPAAAAETSWELPYELTVPKGREAAADHLKDNDYRTRFTLAQGQSLSISWTEEAGGRVLSVSPSADAMVSLCAEGGHSAFDLRRSGYAVVPVQRERLARE